MVLGGQKRDSPGSDGKERDGEGAAPSQILVRVQVVLAFGGFRALTKCFHTRSASSCWTAGATKFRRAIASSHLIEIKVVHCLREHARATVSDGPGYAEPDVDRHTHHNRPSALHPRIVGGANLRTHAVPVPGGRIGRLPPRTDRARREIGGRVNRVDSCLEGLSSRLPDWCGQPGSACPAGTPCRWGLWAVPLRCGSHRAP